jgi:hypothetical protein
MDALQKCEARGLVCDAESKVLGPKSRQTSLASSVDLVNISSLEDFGIPLSLSPIPPEMTRNPDDYHALHCIDLRCLPAFNAAPLAFDSVGSQKPEFIYSSNSTIP